MRGRPGVRDSAVIGAVVFSVAFAVRIYWTMRVQNPLDAVYSDMAGYVLRADFLLSKTIPAEPRMLVLWPWGTHALVAGEFALLGRHSGLAIGVCHAFVGAIVAPCVAALTCRFVASRAAALLAGLLVALWQPNIVFTGYFSSEIWFTCAIIVGTVFLVRHSETGRGALVAGVSLAIAFAVRPQVLFTLGLVVGALALARLRAWRSGVSPASPSLLASRRLALVPLLLPLCLTMAFSAVRYRRLTGHGGLISDNEPVQRLFGHTDVVKIESSWNLASGGRWTFNFQSSKPIDGPASDANTERFEGYIEDAEILERIRKRRLEGVTVGRRVRRAVDNASLLVARSLPWPETNIFIRWRRRLQVGFSNGLFVVLAFAAIGLFSLRRHATAGLIVGAHLATITYVGAFYVGEARFRTPYDPFLLVLAVAGLWTVARALTGFGRRLGRSAG